MPPAPICPLPVFPAQFAIPPAHFYNNQGLATWLNQHPSYKQFFAGYFPYLFRPEFITSSYSSLNYDIYHVPLQYSVQQLSQAQGVMYNQQLQLFRKVYGYNSNAYVNYVCNGTPPMYYTYKDYKEKNNMRSAIALVNKLYPFDIMSKASTLNWQIPFPIGA
jgi:hypothetical protein